MEAELLCLKICGVAAFVIAPWMTNIWLLNHSVSYAQAHVLALALVVIGDIAKIESLVFAWPAFCIFGAIYYATLNQKSLFSPSGLAGVFPFVCSTIGSLWLTAGTLNLALLGYDTVWSFLAALHSSFLGWLFVGCLFHLSRSGGRLAIFYLFACDLNIVFFSCVALGIDGRPALHLRGIYTDIGK